MSAALALLVGVALAEEPATVEPEEPEVPITPIETPDPGEPGSRSGVVGGVAGGVLPRGSRVQEMPGGITFCELVVRTEVQPTYPELRRPLGRPVRCEVRADVDAHGEPAGIEVSGCPAAFRRATRAAFEQWRWWPCVRHDGSAADVHGVAVVGVTFERPR